MSPVFAGWDIVTVSKPGPICLAGEEAEAQKPDDAHTEQSVVFLLSEFHFTSAFKDSTHLFFASSLISCPTLH